MSNKVRKAVIREDLLSITSDFREAIVLNQFIYWSERASDADVLIEKENEIAKNNGEEEKEPFYGWIYKTADELAEEIMLGLSASQVRRYINKLVECGYIAKRNNPKYKWDRTLQYKVNLVNIARALKKNGYPLSDYKISLPDDEKCNTHTRTMENEPVQNQERVGEHAIPEITTENTDRDYNAETTKGDTLSFDNAKADTMTSKKPLPHVAQKKSRAELKELEQDMINRFCKAAQQYDVTEVALNNIINAFKRYLCRYTEKTNKVHPILKDETLDKIFIALATIDDEEYSHYSGVADYEVDEYGISYLDELVDEHFKSEHQCDTDYHISHFANSNYLSLVAQHIVEY